MYFYLYAINYFYRKSSYFIFVFLNFRHIFYLRINKKAQIPLSIWAKSCVPMQEKYELVARVIAGNTKREVALNAGINPGMLYQLY